MTILQTPQSILWNISINRKTVASLFLMVSASGLSLVLIPPEARPVALPLLTLINLALGFVITLGNRDRQLPLFEAGAVLVAITTLYSIVPLLNFWIGGLRWSVLSDNRLFNYQTTPVEVGGFAWRHVLYLASFVVVYLLVRGRTSAPQAGVRRVGRAITIVILVWLAVFTAYFAIVEAIYAVSFNPSYSAVRAGLVRLPTELPYVLQQIASYGQGILFVLKLCVLVLLLQRLRSRFWRTVLIVWLAGEAVATALRLGARTETAMLLLSAVLLYHRLVKPLTLRRAAIAAGVFLAGIVLYGFAREFSSEPLSLSAALSASNEFQTLFGTAYDLYQRKATGGLIVPGQLYFSELYLLIPSRLISWLPFYPWDPSEWYLEVIGQRGMGVGFLFGVVSQSIIGWGWVELAARGAVLGFLFAKLHRWHVRRASSMWVTLLYLYVCIWSYYTYRATSFYFAYYVIYRFLPAFLLVMVSGSVLRSVGRRRA